MVRKGDPGAARKLEDMQQQLGHLLRPLSRASSRPGSAVKAPAAAAAGSRGRSGAASDEEALQVVSGGSGSVDAPVSPQLRLHAPSAADAADSSGSPRIGAVYGGTGHAWQQPAGASDGTVHAWGSRTPAAQQGGQQQEQQQQQHGAGPGLSPAVAQQQLQQILEAEMAREQERATLLAEATDNGDRRRLAHFFELERQNALILIEQLQAMCLSVR